MSTHAMIASLEIDDQMAIDDESYMLTHYELEDGTQVDTLDEAIEVAKKRLKAEGEYECGDSLSIDIYAYEYSHRLDRERDEVVAIVTFGRDEHRQYYTQVRYYA